MSIVRCEAFLGIGLLVCLVVAAKSDEVPNLQDAQMIAAGRALFEAKQCTFCHGTDGKGGVRLAGRSDLEPGYVFQTIADGRVRAGRRMPSWRGVLTDEQIWQATAYVMTLSRSSY
jgi:mono/diheme cytochrome c family protein